MFQFKTTNYLYKKLLRAVDRGQLANGERSKRTHLRL